MAFDIPRNVILPVDAVDVRLEAGPHPFEVAHAAAIEENWQREIASQPALYDGRMMLHSSLAYRDRRIVGTCHVVRYATLMYWRRHRDTPLAEHAFAQAALVSADNALVAIRMGAHTAVAGKVYFAAGSFEEPDFPNGYADVDANMAREVGEETGLGIAALPREPSYHLHSSEGGTIIFRRYYFEQDADELAARIRAHVAAEAEPEIDGPELIRSAADRPAGLLPYMSAIIDWHFNGG